MDISENKTIEKVYIKLGTQCNLHCQHCHSLHTDIIYNPDILPVLKSLNLIQISFGGGEPLLYWDIIKEIVEYIGDNVTYRVVTNGTLFTEDIVDFCNRHKFLFFISIDGNKSTRDTTVPIQWDLIKKLRFCGTSSTFYEENSNLNEILECLQYYKENYLSISADKLSSFPCFVHSTIKTGILSNRGLADAYIQQAFPFIEESLILFKKGILTGLLRYCFETFCKIKNYCGVRCCQNKYIQMLSNGDICSCAYTLDKIGDIFHLNDIDWNQVQLKYARPACQTCDIFNICHNYCCKNITDDECYIMKKMHDNMVFLMKKYNVSYDELDQI